MPTRVSERPHIVLMIHDDYPAGGNQRSAMNVHAALVSAGFSAEILCIKLIGTEGLAARYPFVRAASPQHRHKALFWPHFCASLRARMARHPQHIYLALGLTSSLAFALCSWGLRVRGLIGSERTYPPLAPIRPLFRLARKLLFRRLDRIVVQSPRTISWYQESLRIPADRVVVIPNIVAAAVHPATNRNPQEVPTLLCVSRLDATKGLDDALRILVEVRRSLPNCRLEIYGQGPEKESLQSLAAHLGVSDQVDFRYVGNDLRDIWPRADVFLFTSHYEGFPNALAEAMAHGLACVSFDCLTGPAELIRHNENGYLVPPRDCEAAARHVVQLLKDREKRQQIADEARKVAQEFSQSAVAKRWTELVQQVFRNR